ncbi:SGNH/GDSL hydrolase family protein [Streptomyces sp. TRM66268-LWL]|uniref:SGNH/GDSL hydrolase family protein n=1 Tax=Streptomyces polyasparticus TaxID=2767826 RepID=A0ABR7S975_9ACTN|nr:SGNH/GDSL hydrolase family protein [Streptomyces polyasparticus]MBC9712020.1 SGNH/GDSL hydrolase family protein [Streptomyces polyasparticus]
MAGKRTTGVTIALTVFGLLAVAVLGWRLLVASDPSGATSAPAVPASRNPEGKAAPPAEASPPPAATPEPAAEEPAPEGDPVPALYLGDSLAMENQLVLTDLLRKTAAVRNAPYSGTTVCDYLESAKDRSLVPPQHKAAALVREEKPAVVVLQFWGNSWGYTPCMGSIKQGSEPYYERYAADTRALTAEIERAAADVGIARPKLVWVLQGPDPMTPDRIRRINGLYEKQAAEAGDLTADAGAAVSRSGDRYTHVQHLPCTRYERAHPEYCTGGDTTQLHRDDDYLHFCLAPTTTTPRPCPKRSPGILRYSKAIADAVGDHVRATRTA